MDRREFLIGLGAALIVAPAAVVLGGCGKSSSDNTSAPSTQGTTFTIVSSVVFDHAHTVTILFTDLTNPTSPGITYQSDGSHVHQITLTQQQLTDINNGGTITVTSTVVNNHTHDWTIKKPMA